MSNLIGGLHGAPDFDADLDVEGGIGDGGVEDAGAAGGTAAMGAAIESGHAAGALAQAQVVPMRRLPGSPGDLPDPALPQNVAGGFYATWKSDLYVNDATATDPAQGQLGDCFLVSAMSAAAMTDPAQLKGRITDHGDGTYTVRLTEKAEDGKTKDVNVRVDADFIVDGSSFPEGTDTSALTGAMPADVRLFNVRSTEAQGAKAELWPTVIEKAYAKWKGGYEAINQGGHMHESLTALTGHDTKYGYTSSSADEVWQDLTSALKEKRPALASTKFPTDGAVADGLVPGHAYTVMGAAEKNGQKMLTLRNPWGHGEPGKDGKDDGIFEMSMADFQKNFGVYIATTGKPPQKVEAPRDPFSSWGGGGG